MGRMSRQKGKRGEREWAAFLTGKGAPARRGQQFSGDPTAADVVCAALSGYRFEVKRAETISVYKALEQADTERFKDQTAVVVHRQNGKKWIVVMYADDWIGLALLAKAFSAAAPDAAPEVPPQGPESPA